MTGRAGGRIVFLADADVTRNGGATMPTPREQPPWTVDDTVPPWTIDDTAGAVPWKIDDTQPQKRLLTDDDLFGPVPVVSEDDLFGPAPKPKVGPQLRAAPGAQPWQPPATDVYLDANGNPIPWEDIPGSAPALLTEDDIFGPSTPPKPLPEASYGVGDVLKQVPSALVDAPAEFLKYGKGLLKGGARLGVRGFNLLEDVASGNAAMNTDLPPEEQARQILAAEQRFKRRQRIEEALAPRGTAEKVGGVVAENAPYFMLAGGAVARGVRGLRGLSTSAKARNVARATATLGKEGAKAWAADKGLKAVGVPGEARAAILTAAGFTRPGEAARGAVKSLFGRGAATTARGARTIAQEVNAARRAAETARALGADKAATLAAARAAREAAATQAVARARALRGGAADPEQLVLKVQQAMSMPGGKQAVREWLRAQPPEVAAQIESLLSSGESRAARLFRSSL